MEIDDDELLAPRILPKYPADGYTYVISKEEAIKYIDMQIRTFKQFYHFPPGHPSYPRLRRTGAIYEYIKDALCRGEPQSPGPIVKG